MRKLWLLPISVCLAWGILSSATLLAVPQAPVLKRTAEGKPDLNGVWQVLNTAAWDIQDHTGELGIPPGQGVVEGNEIPYLPAAAAKKQQNSANRATADPAEAQCFMPGVPRSTYMPFPFEIVQSKNTVAIRYEFTHAVRVIYMDGS